MRAEKKYIIAEVETHLKKSDYVILANYNQVTVSDVAELRAGLRAEKAEFHVVKNSSLKVAAKALGLPDIDESLSGPTAIVVGGENVAGVAKVLKKFFEAKQKLEIKVGVMEKKLVSAKDLNAIADLPPFDALRSQFLSLLTSNAASFVRLLDAKAKKDAGPEAPAAEAPAAA
ncbi:50S ribosomal protein L10 [Opitutaceae bacterium TAV4]|nr:50S ribosomal protein L10 [Opitutaceae bacterium TAV4]RRJ99399.1 50S ribosomal protein L10 [Opitutaceae bacterium TAV3]